MIVSFDKINMIRLSSNQIVWRYSFGGDEYIMIVYLIENIISHSENERTRNF